MTLAELPYGLSDLFPPGDFAFHMRFRRGEISQFYRNSPQHDAIIAERLKWLRLHPNRYAAALPESEPLLAEASELANSIGVEIHAPAADAGDHILQLGAAWEPDVLLLKSPQLTDHPVLLAGCVCFPSSWALEEKMRQPLDAIHAPVPTLNDQFANPVQQFLSRIKPGISWERINWGLSRSPELNQHPTRNLPRLDANVQLQEVWFRAEYQSLVALPKSGGVLFGIRLAIEPLANLCRHQQFRAGIAAAIRSMPEPIAAYKGLAAARRRLLDLLAP